MNKFHVSLLAVMLTASTGLVAMMGGSSPVQRHGLKNAIMSMMNGVAHRVGKLIDSADRKDLSFVTKCAFVADGLAQQATEATCDHYGRHRLLQGKAATAYTLSQRAGVAPVSWFIDRFVPTCVSNSRIAKKISSVVTPKDLDLVTIHGLIGAYHAGQTWGDTRLGGLDAIKNSVVVLAAAKTGRYIFNEAIDRLKLRKKLKKLIKRIPAPLKSTFVQETAKTLLYAYACGVVNERVPLPLSVVNRVWRPLSPGNDNKGDESHYRSIDVSSEVNDYSNSVSYPSLIDSE